jgi:hypothetical protein
MIDQLAEDLEFAKNKILENRLLAWSSVGSKTDIDKLVLIPLSAKAWIDLKIISNKFVSEGRPDADDALEYLWRNCEAYSTVQNAATEKTKKRLGYLLGKNGENYIINLAYKHINDAFTELPQSVNNNKNSINRSNRMPAIEGIIGAIDEVAARYGQNPADTLEWPLNRIFQLQKAIRLATIPNYKLAEPQLIKTIKKEILQELNNGTKS